MDKDAAANYLDVQKITLVAAFNQVSMAMRECANHAEQFAQSISSLPAGGNVNPQTLQLITAAMNAMPRTNTFPHMAQAMFQMPTADTTGAAAATPAKGKRVRGAAAKKKAERDPNKPKRPASAYLMYQNVVRKDIAGKHPGLPYHEVLTKISEQWSQLPDEDKEPYREATRQAKTRYEAMKADYDATLGPNGEIPEVSSPIAPPTPIVPTAKVPKAVKSAPVVLPQAESSDEGSEEGSSSEDDDEEEEEEEQPAHKKHKVAAVTAPPVVQPVVPEKKGKAPKEKKSKKA